MRETSFAEGAGLDRLDPDETEQLVDSLIAADGFRVARAATGDLLERIAEADSEEALMAILQANEVDEGPLYEALHRASFAFRLKAAGGSE